MRVRYCVQSAICPFAGFPTKLLNDFTQACISTSKANEATSASTTPQAAEPSSEQPEPAVAGPSKEDVRKLSTKHSYKHVLHKAEKAKESKEAIGRLLDTCTTIVAEQEAAAIAQAALQERKQEKRLAQEKQVLKGNYTGRKKALDKSTETDFVTSAAVSHQGAPPSTAATASVGTTEAAKSTATLGVSNNRLPTPTSPTRNAAPSNSTNGQARPEVNPSSSRQNAERAAKAAKLAANFQHVLNSKQLNFTKQELEQYNTRHLKLGHGQASSTLFSSAINSSKLPNGPRAPLHPALNGLNGVSGSSSVEPARPASSREGGRARTASTQATGNGSFRPVGGTNEFTVRASGSTATSRIIQDRSASTLSKTAKATSTSMNETTQNATSTDSASSSSANNAKSIYDLVPEDILQKKKSPHAYNTSLPPRDVDTSMQVDGGSFHNTAPSSREGRTTMDRSQASQSPPIQISLALPAAGITGREKEKQTETSDVGTWFGSAEPQDGAYSPLEMDDYPPAPTRAPPTTRQSHPIPSVPHNISISVPSINARPIRTSMSPPPSARARQGTAHSPPPPPPSSATSTLPPAPSHLPARPISTSEANNSNSALPSRPSNSSNNLKAMFPSSFHKQTALPKKAHTYNEVTSSNEAVPIVQKQVRSLDPRMVAAERMKLLREKERDSENSDKEKAGSPPPPPPAGSPPPPPPASIAAIIPNSIVNSISAPDATSTLTSAQKERREPSASPDSLFEGPDNMDLDISDEETRQDAKAYSPPPPNRAQQAANAGMPLPSFKKARQANETAVSVGQAGSFAEDEKKRREMDLKNRLKRAREENAGTSVKESSSKRQATEGSLAARSKSSAQEKDKEAHSSSSASTLEDTANAPAPTGSSRNGPSSTRKLINSAGKKLSDMHSRHDVEDTSDEDEAIQVASRRIEKTSPSKKDSLVPVVEVQVPSSRQGSIASTISAREGSVDSRAGGVYKVKSVVARKSTGGSRNKTAFSSSTTSAPVRQDTTSSATPAPAKESIKLTLKLGGGRSATATTAARTEPAPSSSSQPMSAKGTKSASKATASKMSRTVIEIDDTSDDTDEDDNLPLRKAPITVKKPPVSLSTATPIATPPPSGGRARPKAKPLAGSGKKAF